MPELFTHPLSEDSFVKVWQQEVPVIVQRHEQERAQAALLGGALQDRSSQWGN